VSEFESGENGVEVVLLRLGAAKSSPGAREAGSSRLFGSFPSLPPLSRLVSSFFGRWSRVGDRVKLTSSPPSDFQIGNGGIADSGERARDGVRASGDAKTGVCGGDGGPETALSPYHARRAGRRDRQFECIRSGSIEKKMAPPLGNTDLSSIQFDNSLRSSSRQCKCECKCKCCGSKLEAPPKETKRAKRTQRTLVQRLKRPKQRVRCRCRTK